MKPCQSIWHGNLYDQIRLQYNQLYSIIRHYSVYKAILFVECNTRQF